MCSIISPEKKPSRIQDQSSSRLEPDAHLPSSTLVQQTTSSSSSLLGCPYFVLLMYSLPACRPVVFHPLLKKPQDIDALVELAQLGELRHRFLAVAEQELLSGTKGGGAKCPLLEHHQLVIAHAPSAGKVLPVLDSVVCRVELQSQHVQEVLIVQQVADFRRWNRTEAFLTGARQALQILAELLGGESPNSYYIISRCL